MNILVLAAGSSEAFREAGFTYPKSLVEIEGKPAIERVILNLKPLIAHAQGKVVFIVPKEESRKFHVDAVIRLLLPRAVIIQASEPTAGAACTALLAVDEIDSDMPLVVLNADEILEIDLPKVIDEFTERKLDGGVVVFRSVHPKWSFVRCDADGLVVECAEKTPISDLATAGFYYYRKGRDMVSAIETMMLKQATVNGQYYLCPAYNEMILNASRVGVFEVPQNKYVTLKTPQDVARYSEKVAQR
jgi:dTDP-glucose pyrophosphorylase